MEAARASSRCSVKNANGTGDPLTLQQPSKRKVTP